MLYTKAVDLGALIPGSYVVLLGAAEEAVEMRRRGFSLRDSLTIFRPSGVDCALLFRVPFPGTLVENVLTHGSGGIYIDGCRIGTGSDKGVWPITARVDERNSMAGPMRPAETDLTKGRWPTNTLFVHTPSCVPGTRKIHGNAPTPSGFDRLNEALAEHGYRPGAYQKGRPPPPPSRLDEEGMETIPSWACIDGCPVLLLDEQSGERVSGAGAVKRATSAGFQGVAYGKESRPAGTEMHSYADTGGASRYYPQFGSYEDAIRWIETLLQGLISGGAWSRSLPALLGGVSDSPLGRAGCWRTMFACSRYTHTYSRLGPGSSRGLRLRECRFLALREGPRLRVPSPCRGPLRDG